MKLSGQRIEGFLAAPDPAMRAVLVYGPDAGLIGERLDRLTRAICIDPADPFRVTNLPAAELKEDPARLADEVAALAMTGGRRVVRLRDAGDGVTSVLASLLADPAGDALLLIEGGELGPRSSLRRLVEAADNAAALACYGDDGGTLDALIHRELKSHGLTPEPDAVAWLADHLGGDRLQSRSELAKLALYMGRSGRVRLEDAAACVGDAAALSLDGLAIAAAGGDPAAGMRMVDRLFAEGTSPVTVLRSLQRHFQRLHWAAGALAGGRPAEQAVAMLRPPPHFTLADAMRRQLVRWPPSRLAAALDLLLEAEIDAKTTGRPAHAICARAVLRLSHAASRLPVVPR
jgi:DNA polymerase-3 subunit delta